MGKTAPNKKLGVTTQIARGARVVTSALALFAVAAESYGRDIGALGGGGGSEFRTTCRPGDVLIGFFARNGSALDFIVPHCARLNSLKTDWGDSHRLSQLGGPGGPYIQQLLCNQGDVVRHLHVYVDGHKIVNRINITCTDLDFERSYDLVMEYYGGEAVGDVRFSCGEHEWGTGIFGRHGALIDQLGLQCELLWPHCETYATRAQAQVLEGIRDCNFSGDRWNPSKSFHFAWCVGLRGDQGPPNAETEARDQALQQCAAGPPPPQTCAVTQPTDVYDNIGGNKIGVLQVGTEGVTLVEPCRVDNSWCHVRWPAGQGWVYTGPDYPSLNCP